MHYRTEAFQRKFRDAARHLKVRPEEIVSLKLRENVGSHQEYREFLHEMEQVADLKHSPADGDLQGKGYMVNDGRVRVIVVEHETGLEILYIAGSIASLVGIVPILLQGWRAFRGRKLSRPEMDYHGIELRRLDAEGNLREEHVREVFAHGPTSGGLLNSALISAAKLVESDLNNVKNQLRALTTRVEALEQATMAKPKRRNTRKSAKATSKPQPGSPDAKLAHLLKRPDNERGE